MKKFLHDKNSYFIEDEALPKNTNKTSSSLEVGGSHSSLEVIVDVTSAVTITATKVLTITLQESADNETFTDKAILYTFTSASGATNIAVQEGVCRYTLPVDIKKYARVKVATDDGSAAGAISAYLHLV